MNIALFVLALPIRDNGDVVRFRTVGFDGEFLIVMSFTGKTRVKSGSLNSDLAG